MATPSFAMRNESSSSSISVQEYQLRGAIALNNLGVRLLEKRKPRQANKTLKAAIDTMRHASSGNQFQEDSSTEAILAALHDKVRRSERILSRTATTTGIVETNDDLVCSIKAVSIDDTLNLRETSPAATSENAATNCQELCPILIESLNKGDLCCDLLSSIMVYNLGISFLCLRMDKSSGISLPQLLECSVNVLKAANDILINGGGRASAQDLTLFVAIHIRRTLLPTLKAMGDVEKERSCMSSLTFLLSLAKEYEQNRLISPPTYAGAA